MREIDGAVAFLAVVFEEAVELGEELGLLLAPAQLESSE